MKTRIGHKEFSYQTSTGCTRGFFNIYQAKDGKIYLQMGNGVIALTELQLLALAIDVYDLVEFDHDLYEQAYSTSKIGGRQKRKEPSKNGEVIS